MAKNDVEPPANSVGRSGGADLEPSSNAGGNERARKAALPAPTDGMTWRWDVASHAARFGVPPNGTSFAIACDRGRLVLRRFDAAPRGGQGTMSFTGNGRVASLPAASVGDTTSLSSLWQAVERPSDRTAAVARVFDGPAPVEIALAGTTKLVTRSSALPARAFAACAPPAAP
ncbi:MAG: hypothetical protein ABR588_06140 [Sphingomicrobium sp.]|nr:hypothetical protein [Sphingomonadales bacterium]